MEKGIVNRQLLKRKADTLSEPEVAEVLEYIGIMEFLRDDQMQFLRDDQSAALTETIAKLLCEAMIAAPEPRRNQMRRDPAKN